MVSLFFFLRKNFLKEGAIIGRVSSTFFCLRVIGLATPTSSFCRPCHWWQPLDWCVGGSNSASWPTTHLLAVFFLCRCDVSPRPCLISEQIMWPWPTFGQSMATSGTPERANEPDRYVSQSIARIRPLTFTQRRRMSPSASETLKRSILTPLKVLLLFVARSLLLSPHTFWS